MRFSSSIWAVCYLLTLFWVFAPQTYSGETCRGDVKGRQVDKMRAGAEQREEPSVFYYITDYRVTNSFDPDMSSASWSTCVCAYNVCNVTSATYNLPSFVAVSGHTAVWAPPRLSDWESLQCSLSVASASLGALMAESERRCSHPSLSVRVNRLCLPTRLHLAPWFAAEMHPSSLLQSEGNVGLISFGCCHDVCMKERRISPV